ALASARHFGRSVRAPISIHIAYNLIVTISIFATPAPVAERSQEYLQCTNRSGAVLSDAAVSACTAIIQSNKQSKTVLAEAYAYRGAAFVRQHQYSQAIDDYAEAIRLAPRSAAVFAARCDVYTRILDYDLAIADCDEAIRLDHRLAGAF